VQARSLVIVGTADEAAPPADARALHALLPDAELVELPGAGHLANLEQPDRFETLVLAFLIGDDQEILRA
jgi:3-oxoadipate enol-lactonase